MTHKIKPGIYPDVPINEYHSSEGVSNSGIKLLLECPKKYQHHYLSGESKNISTKAMVEGNQFHTYILEPEKFKDQYFISEKMIRRGKKWDEVVENSEQKEIIFTDRLAELEKMKASLMSFNRAGALLSGGVAEVSIYWEDQDTGVMCKSRPDYLNVDKKFITDLKTTEDASPSGFARSVSKYNYYVQAAMMFDGFKAVTGEDLMGVFNFAIEKSPPYCSGVYLIDEQAIEIGREVYKNGLRVFAEHRECDHWPSYSDDIEEVSLPAWAISD